MAKQKVEETKVKAEGAKNFKNNSDIESFYQFIYENKLRAEASSILNLVHAKLNPKKKRKSRTLQ